jgi:hypothetical protein
MTMLLLTQNPLLLAHAPKVSRPVFRAVIAVLALLTALFVIMDTALTRLSAKIFFLKQTKPNNVSTTQQVNYVLSFAELT